MTFNEFDLDAFPNTNDDSACRGMSLRDYFAAQAMTLLGRTMDVAGQKAPTAAIAEALYGIADAMLKERAK